MADKKKNECALRIQITQYYVRHFASGLETTELSKRPRQFAWLKEAERDTYKAAYSAGKHMIEKREQATNNIRFFLTFFAKKIG